MASSVPAHQHQHQARPSDAARIPAPETLPDTYIEPSAQDVVQTATDRADTAYTPEDPEPGMDTGGQLEADDPDDDVSEDDDTSTDDDDDDDDDDDGLTPTRADPPSLRASTLNQPRGVYTEDESLMSADRELLLRGEAGQAVDEREDQRRVTTYVAASHRRNLSVQSKLESAERASALHEKITGYPLEINAATGEVVTETGEYPANEE
ncbi:hypothetical protein SeLEV6574_g06755 [Synchytrium endobioticum]|uniref:Uncharacterized protein n=1 Tax=Synchytrium endobioticum TaxID=286115 RepID=A0A507CK97_9FUNG|nr:hypothetical protein SeLEV6574_g06755 [Synchytrium endobioticum]